MDFRKTSAYQYFLSEREEILKHKWIESEKRGIDIGFERALVEWTRKYRTLWRSTKSEGKGARE